MKSFIISFLCIGFLLAFTSTNKEGPEDHPDYQAVHEAISNYVNGLYMVDSTLIEASVHPELRKRGYWYHTESSSYRDNLDMSFEQLRHLAATWNENGKMADENSIKKIEIYDINDKTASARLTAVWGLDYFHLARIEDHWYITNVLWQSLPEKM
jgi:hypothetical protein